MVVTLLLFFRRLWVRFGKDTQLYTHLTHQFFFYWFNLCIMVHLSQVVINCLYAKTPPKFEKKKKSLILNHTLLLTLHCELFKRIYTYLTFQEQLMSLQRKGIKARDSYWLNNYFFLYYYQQLVYFYEVNIFSPPFVYINHVICIILNKLA